MSFKNAKIHPPGVDSQAYHADMPKRGEANYPASPSMLKAFGQSCPARWVGGYKPPQSDAMKFGNVVDCLVLTPELFEKRYAVTPETYSPVVMECPQCGSQTDSKSCRKCKCDRVEKRIEKAWSSKSEFCAAWEAEQGERELVSAQTMKDAHGCQKALLGDAKINELLSVSQKQVLVTGEWHDEGTGLVIPARCLIDLVPSKDSAYAYALADLKTAQSCEPSRFSDDGYKYGYDIQAAFDLDLFNAATGEGRGQWCWVAVEPYEPYIIGRRFDEEDSRYQFICNGRARYRRILKLYCQCLKNGTWPGYDDTAESANGWTGMELKPWKDETQIMVPTYLAGQAAGRTVAEVLGDDINV